MIKTKVIAGVLLALLAAGCSEVKPWQKQVLGEPYMEMTQTRATHGFVAHAQITVEQAEGGDGGAGGGCGCR